MSRKLYCPNVRYSMSNESSFLTAYRELENRMERLVENDGHIFVPNPEPSGPVHYVFVCMEPSLGGHSAEELRSRVEAGSRNFLNSIEDFLLHFSARRYLCEPEERYHITDVSKGGMLVSKAGASRQERYDRWHRLLEEEINLITVANPEVFAVGKVVADHLRRKDFPESFTRILHYSPQAARARNIGIKDHKERFEAFKNTVSLNDVIAIAEDILSESSVPVRFRDETLSRLERRKLTPSRKKLIFNYKLAFEST